MPHEPSEAAVEAALDVWFGATKWKEWFPSTGEILRGDMRRALIAAAAAQEAPTTPPAGTVPVRVAVALDEEGHYAGVSKISEGESESLIWDEMAECGYPRRSCIATIHAPIPPVPELPATVEATDA